MKLQIRFEILGADQETKLKRSKAFSGIDDLASKENLVNFAQAYMGLQDIKEYQVYKISEENLEEA